MSYLKLLLPAAFFNCILWIVLIPIWQYPDEQAHFAQVQDITELGKVPTVGSNTSYEIALSEKILGTERDGSGNNKYTYHPEYNILYSDNSIGLFEKELLNLHKESRTNLVKSEATLNPPLYYFFGSIAYKLAYNGSLLDRVYAVRLMSALIFMGTVILSLKIGLIIFDKEKYLSIILPSLIAFKPMLTFASTGVLPDSLTNFLFTSILYLSLKIFKDGLKFSTLILILLTVALGVSTRQQFLISVLIISVPILYTIYTKPKYIKHFILTLLSFSLFIYFSNTLLIGSPFFANFRVPEIFDTGFLRFGTISFSTFISYFIWSMRHTYSEVWPWYWGVYKWLSLTLPPVYYQTINRVILVGLIGLVIKFVLIVREREVSKNTIYPVFLLAASLIYFLTLVTWDYIFYLKHGFSFGIQSRYFFPLVVAHISLILIGFWQLFKIFLKNYAKFGLVILAFLIIVFNDLSLFHVAGSYYDTSSLESFVTQASQYKPLFVKGNTILFTLALNMGFQLLLIFFLLKNAIRQTR